jgi:hypothetical protein
MLQEVDYRERNLRFAEISIFALIAEHLIMLSADQLPTAPENRVKIKRSLHDEIGKMLGKYEAELYQDRYLPEYQRTMREISRREKEEAEDKRRRDQAALDRVATFASEDTPPSI